MVDGLVVTVGKFVCFFSEKEANKDSALDKKETPENTQRDSGPNQDNLSPPVTQNSLVTLSKFSVNALGDTPSNNCFVHP